MYKKGKGLKNGWLWLLTLTFRYVEWASHEPEEGTYDFKGILDLATWITTAQEEDLVVILRLGPFEDAERDMVRNGALIRV